MKTASGVLFAIGFIANLISGFVLAIRLSPYGVSWIGWTILAIFFVGGILRIITSENHPIASGFLTLIIFGTSVVGILSAIFLWCSIDTEGVQNTTYTDTKQDMAYFINKKQLMHKQYEQSLISETELNNSLFQLKKEVKSYFESLKVEYQGLKERLNKGLISEVSYRETKLGLEKEINLVLDYLKYDRSVIYTDDILGTSQKYTDSEIDEIALTLTGSKKENYLKILRAGNIYKRGILYKA